MIDTPTVDIIHDTRYVRKDKKSRVKLRVTYRRKQKYYSTPLILSEAEFEKVFSGRSRTEQYIKYRRKLEKLKEKAQEVIEDLDEFTFKAFELRYEDPKGKASVKSVYDTYIERLKANGRPGTVQNYQSSINSILKFVKEIKAKDNLYFEEVNESFLTAYQSWMRNKGKSNNTIGMYLRPLRVMFNQAIEDGVVKKSKYPFGKKRYRIPSVENKKRALTLTDIEKLFLYETIPGSPEDKAKDMWFFSYLCNGINMRDICELKYRNINFDSGKIQFIRKKTENTTADNQTFIDAVITDEVKEIISKWGNENISPNNYVFPFLTLNDTPEIIFKKVRQVTKNTNKYMKRIGEALELKIPITTYTARHSYSTVLKQSDVSIEFISESLGHRDLKTTEKYLGSFDDETKLKASEHLLNFKKRKKE